MNLEGRLKLVEPAPPPYRTQPVLRLNETIVENTIILLNGCDHTLKTQLQYETFQYLESKSCSFQGKLYENFISDITQDYIKSKDQIVIL